MLLPTGRITHLRHILNYSNAYKTQNSASQQDVWKIIAVSLLHADTQTQRVSEHLPPESSFTRIMWTVKQIS